MQEISEELEYAFETEPAFILALAQNGIKEQFVMRAERKEIEWVAVLESIAKTDRAVW